PEGKLGFTEGAGKIGQITPTTHAIAEFPVPTATSFPLGITAAPDDNLWFTELEGNNIGQINPTTHAIAEFPIPTPNSSPFGIAAGPDGNLWFTELNVNKIGQLVLKPAATAPDLALKGTVSVPNPLTVGSNATFNFTVTNNGTAAATGVTLTDTLPAGAMLVSATGGVTPVHGVLNFL